MIVYPLLPPSGHKTSQKIKLTAWTRTAVNVSPYTGQQQVYQWPGEGWLLDVALPPMKMTDAEVWISFLAALRGRAGTFLYGDTARKTPQGTALASTDTNYPSPIVGGYGQSAADKQLSLGYARASATGWMLAGDYIQICENLIPSPYTLETNWTIHEGAVTQPFNDPWGNAGATGARRLTPSGGATDCYAARSLLIDGTPGRTFDFSVWLRANSGTPAITITLRDYELAGATTVTANLTTSWKRFFVSHAMPSTASGVQAVIGGGNSWVEADGAVDVWGIALTCDSIGARLHKVLNDVTTDSSGNATVDIFPSCHAAYNSFSKLVTSTARGQFRLATDKTEWDIDAAKVYGISFQAVEAL